MDSIRSILAATDFSQHAMHAARRAAVIAVEHKAALTLMHVVESEGLVVLRDWLAPGRDLQAAISAQAEMELAVQANQLTQEQRVPVDRQLKIGSAELELERALDSNDLLVLGVRGSRPASGLAFGTTAARLLGTATKPLLVVKTSSTTSYRRVLVLVDFSASSVRAMHTALQLAPRASVNLLHSFELPYEGKLRVAGVAEEDVAAYFAAARQRALQQFQLLRQGELASSTRISAIVEHGDIRLQFLKSVEQLRPDLIAVGKGSQSRFADVFLGSVSRTVLAESPCDVLVVPPGDQSAFPAV